MQSQKLAIVTTMALLVISALSTLTLESASAYEKKQATSQTSACGNEFMPINIGCPNTNSQIQGDENAAALTAQQTFPEVKLVQEKPTPEPTPEPTPMTATLRVCNDPDSTIIATYDISGINPMPDEISLVPGDCQDITIGPGDYVVTQVGLMVSVSGDCNPGPEPDQGSGSIQAGETQVCNFFSTQCCSASLSSKDERSYS
jgi:hypothetical protein